MNARWRFPRRLVTAVGLLAAAAGAAVAARPRRYHGPAGTRHGERGAGARAPAPCPARRSRPRPETSPTTRSSSSSRDPAAGYSIRYPEGWTQKGLGRDVTFQGQDQRRPRASSSRAPRRPPPRLRRRSWRAEARRPHVRPAAPALTIGGAPVVKVTYTRSARPTRSPASA